MKRQPAWVKRPSLLVAIGSGVDVESRSQGQVEKPGLANQLEKLCLRQSTGNSTGPEADVGSAVIGNRNLDDDVGNPERAARS